MPEVKYGKRIITFEFQLSAHLKAHYITVEKGKGVTLKGGEINLFDAQNLILKKARWIIKKLELVESIGEKDIVSGSRIQYLGRSYYAQVIFSEEVKKTTIDFNESKFIIRINLDAENTQEQIKLALDKFYRDKVKEKILPRLNKWSNKTGLTYNILKIQKLEKRWGSCTGDNNILINYNAIKLPFSLIDYLLVHELCHTIEKNHSKTFYSILSKHLPNWKSLDEKMAEMKL